MLGHGSQLTPPHMGNKYTSSSLDLGTDLSTMGNPYKHLKDLWKNIKRCFRDERESGSPAASSPLSPTAAQRHRESVLTSPDGGFGPQEIPNTLFLKVRK